MNAAGVRAREKRLFELTRGLHAEFTAVSQHRGELSPDEWTAYLAAIRQANTALGDAWLTLALAANRLDGNLQRPLPHQRTPILVTRSERPPRL